MSTASDIITAAYREGNIIPVGTTPTADEQTEALALLNRYSKAIFGYELGENLTDWEFPAPQRTAPVAADYPALPWPTDVNVDAFPLPLANDPDLQIWPYPPGNSRIVWGSTTGTCYFGESPADGTRMALVQGSGAGDSGVAGAIITLDGNGRTIGGASTQAYTAPLAAPVQWFYRADLADWTVIADMALTDTMPYPEAFDEFFVCALALRIAPRYGKTTAPETAKCAVDTLKRLKAYYAQTQNTVYGSEDMPRSLQSFVSGRWWF